MNKREIFLLGVILAAAAAVRCWGLDKSPASVGFDEAALGYNAYSLLKTGKDEYGTPLPLSLRSFNDYKPALYAYLSIPAIALMGLNGASIRLVSAAAGVGLLFFVYLLLKQFVGNWKLRLMLLFLLSFLPWSLHFSRVALETNLSACFFAGMAYFGLMAKKRGRAKDFVGCALFMVLAIYSYHSARLAGPALVFCLWLDPLKLIFKKKPRLEIKLLKDWRWAGVLLAAGGLSWPIFAGQQSKLVLTRFRQENVFARFYPYAPRELVKSDNVWQEWRVNPVYYLGGLLTGHILSNFSPVNLTVRVFHWIKHSVMAIADFAILEWISGVIFVLGLGIVIGRLKTDFKSRFLIYWMTAGAMPAAVTWNWFHPLRSLNVYAAVDIIAALGLVILMKYKKWLAGGVIMLWLAAIPFVINNELVYNMWVNNGEYQPGGFKEGVPILAKLQDDYDKVIIDTPHAQSYIFFLFYQRYPPEKFQQYAYLRPAPGVEGNLNFDFDKYEFADFNWLKDKQRKRTIFWTSDEVKEEEIAAEPRARLIKVGNVASPWIASIIVLD